MRRLPRLFRSTIKLYGEARAPLLSAAISFYAIFSLAPIAVIAVAVAGLVLEDEMLRQQIVTYLSRELGPEPARLLGDMMERTASPGAGGLVASITGIAVLLYASSRLFMQLQKALNQIWGIAPKPATDVKRKLLLIVEKRLVSFGLVVFMGVLLLGSVVVSTVASAAGEELARWVHLPKGLTRLVDLGAIGLVLAGTFALLFKLLPDTVVDWRPALIGGLVASALFTVGRVALGFYFGHGAVASEYGAAGSLVVIILWVYYSAQVAFFGAVFTRAYTEDEREKPMTVEAPWRFRPPPAWRERPPTAAGDGQVEPASGQEADRRR